MQIKQEHPSALFNAAFKLYSRNQAIGKPSFCTALFTDRRRYPNPEQIIQALPHGRMINGQRAKRAAVIFREYDLPSEIRYQQGVKLQRLTHACGHLFIVAGDRKLAWRLRADGLHLPQWSLKKGMMKYHYGITTAACHDHRQVSLAIKADLDAIFISPVFTTNSHQQAVPLGRLKLQRLSQKTPMATYALGGITAKTIQKLQNTHIAGIGAIDALADQF